MLKILVLAPHQDDECIGMGGTILKNVDLGNKVHIVYLTSTPSRLEEAETCSKILGTTFSSLEQEDGALEATTQLSSELNSIASGYDKVYCPNKYEKHPDHVATWALAVAAIPTEKLIYYEIWTPLRHPNIGVDITYYLSIKRAAIRSHQSQLINGFDEGIIALNRYRAIMSGTNAYAMEVFKDASQ